MKIYEAGIKALEYLGRPATSKEILTVIEENKWFDFNSKDKTSILRKQMETHSFRYDQKSSPEKQIVSLADGTYDLLLKREDYSKEVLSLRRLHPRVQDKAESLFVNGHYRNCILDVYIDVTTRVRSLSGLSLDGVPLMQKMFSKDNPIMRNSDEQLGFMWLFSGAVMAVRNVRAHSVEDTENDPQVTLEWLSFASLLHRTLDQLEEKSGS